MASAKQTAATGTADKGNAGGEGTTAAKGGEELTKATAAPVMKDIVNLETGAVTGQIDVSGFVTESLAGKGGEDDWRKLSVDRRMYKPEKCARYGGVEGYLVAIESFQSETVKDPVKNPEGWFDALIMRTTAPFPYTNDKGELLRGEAGEDVIVVVTDRLKRVKELCQDEDFVYKLRIMPKERIELRKAGWKLWRYAVDVSPNKVPRSEVGIEAMLGLSEGDRSRQKMLLKKAAEDGLEANIDKSGDKSLPQASA